MKVYGNSKSDGFALLCTVVSGLFLVGGLGLTFVGGIVVWVGVPLLAVVSVLLLRTMKHWDVMSELAQPAGADLGVPVRMPNSPFTVAAESDAVSQPAKAAWSPSADHISNLPAKVEPMKSAVETNTPVV